MTLKKFLILLAFGLLTTSAVVILHGCGSSEPAKNFTLKGAIA